jgi:hypothetical protein
MPRPTITTDMGPWSTLPRRVRVGFSLEMLAAVLAGVSLAAGVTSFATTAILLSGFLIVFVLVFDRRRPWWPVEPGVPVDPLHRGGRRWIVTAGVAATVTLILLLAGVLQF